MVSMKKLHPFWRVFAWFSGISFGLIVVVVVAFLVWISGPLPQTKGEVKIPGLTALVEVSRDLEGVPHIKASNDHDLYLAQGFVTAQDRLFQMDLSRRQASGMLSEVVGEKALERDKFFRTFGLRRAAEASWAAYSEPAKAVLQSYAAGVNAFRAQAIAKGTLSIEFTLLGYQPREWTPVDSLAIGKYMAYDLGGHWAGQAFRSWLMSNVSQQKAFDLFPSYPETAPTILPPGELDLAVALAGAVVPSPFNGSNNWVVAGSKTSSGKPLLADDPHLGLASPSVWYQTVLEGPGQLVSGVIFAGIPGIILGHNEKVAWGVTNTGPDVQDLYIEKRNPANPAQFEHNGAWEDAQVFEESIAVKGKPNVALKVFVTRHGPIITDLAKVTKNTELALQWTALAPTRELEAILQLDRSSSWAEFEKGLELFEAPAQNFVFASVDGTIAFKANGKIPLRKKGNQQVPVPGWNDDNEWTGFIPWDKLPRLVNPKEGFIATANNKVVEDSYPYHLSDTWAQPYREARIKAVLASNDKLTAANLQALQMEKLDLQAQEFNPLYVSLLSGQTLNKQETQALGLLKGWDFVETADGAAPFLYQKLTEKLSTVLFQDAFPKAVYDLFENRPQAVDQLVRRAAAGQVSPWIAEKGGLAVVVKKALELALEEGRKKQGVQMDNWQWGTAHGLRFLHPLSSVKPLNYLFNLKKAVPVGGSSTTVQAARADIDTGYVNHGASWRYVVDLADTSRASHILGPGQSGLFNSPWYDNQVEDWASGSYHVTFLHDQSEAGQVLKLLPAAR